MFKLWIFENSYGVFFLKPFKELNDYQLVKERGANV